jgi:hypothetical protein
MFFIARSSRIPSLGTADARVFQALEKDASLFSKHWKTTDVVWFRAKAAKLAKVLL